MFGGLKKGKNKKKHHKQKYLTMKGGSLYHPSGIDALDIYYNKKEFKESYGRLFKYINTEHNIEAIVLHYFHKPLLTFNEIFNKYLFVQIIYNSAVFRSIVERFMNVFQPIEGNNYSRYLHTLSKLLFNMNSNSFYQGNIAEIMQPFNNPITNNPYAVNDFVSRNALINILTNMGVATQVIPANMIGSTNANPNVGNIVVGTITVNNVHTLQRLLKQRGFWICIVVSRLERDSAYWFVWGN
jgi:hypothetical protein